MKFKSYIIPLLVLVLAGITVYLDAGMAGSGITFALALPLLDLDFDQDDNLPGVNVAYVSLADEIETEAVPVASPTTALEKITIVGSHVMEATKYFSKMYTTLGKGTLKFDPEGSRDFENFKISGELFFPSTKKEALAMSTALLGQDLIVEIEENAQEDFFLQVGTKKFPARINGSADWGTELNGEKGIKFSFETFHGKVPVYIYEGVIHLSDSSVIS